MTDRRNAPGKNDPAPSATGLVLASVYRDSAFLMKLSAQARAASGAAQVSAMMATPHNKELLAASGLLTREMERASPCDLLVAIEAEPEVAVRAEGMVRDLLDPEYSPREPSSGRRPKSLSRAVRLWPDGNLAVISTAGHYARYEAARALSAGLDVLLYSDNVSPDDELALKRLARDKGLLLMGPDCGTAIVDDTPLGFANKVPRGSVGLVASSGTGIQEVSCLLERSGLGISAAYGTGRHDFSDHILGLTAETALERLAADPATRLVLVIALTPGPETRRKMLACYRRLGKPVIVRYAGAADSALEREAGVAVAGDLHELALMAAAAVAPELDVTDMDLPRIARPFPERRGCLRGIFSGGTLCHEAAEQALAILGGGLYSNMTIPGVDKLTDPRKSIGHAFLDMGADEFTVGHPHPMLFPQVKMDRIAAELCDPAVSVVLTDIVLGSGVCGEQSAMLARAIESASRTSSGASRRKTVVASVIGTESDSPPRSEEIDLLRRASVAVAGNNAAAARWAARAASGGGNDR